jgi:hypothetical protein
MISPLYYRREIVDEMIARPGFVKARLQMIQNLKPALISHA